MNISSTKKYQKDTHGEVAVMEVKTTIRYQKDAHPQWPHDLRKLPGCEHLFSCIQCGTCSGTCPLSLYMDYTPRRIINLVREGFDKEALASQTIWLCASCYSCVARCPQKIHITDVMYTLKREAIKRQLFPKGLPIPVLAREFHRMVSSHGRQSEVWLVLRMALRSNPLILLSMVRSGWNLFRTGRLNLRLEKIRGIHELPQERATTEVH
jgi:quinone-modifying oxidoreductase subunit QmoC